VCPTTISENGSTLLKSPDGDERPPARQALRETDAVEPQQRQQHNGGEHHTQEHHRKRRQFFQHHAVEEERPAPQNREQAEQRPVAGVDRGVFDGHGGSYLRFHRFIPLRRAFPPDSRIWTRGGYFGRETISIILPSSSSGISAFARA